MSRDLAAHFASSLEAYDLASKLIAAQQDTIERLKKHLVSVPAGKR